MPRRTKAEAALTRLRIVEAAQYVFSNRGVPRATLEEIANAAGITRGAIYWHFTDKIDVLAALMRGIRFPWEILSNDGLIDCDRPNNSLALALGDFVIQSINTPKYRCAMLILHNCLGFPELKEKALWRLRLLTRRMERFVYRALYLGDNEYKPRYLAQIITHYTTGVMSEALFKKTSESAVLGAGVHIFVVRLLNSELKPDDSISPLQ